MQNNKQAAKSPAWQRSAGKNPAGGLNAKGRASYHRETGGTLKAPVTESNPKGDRAKRQNSFCSRMCGMKRVNTGSKAKKDPDSRINKSLSKWNCKCGSEKQAFVGGLLSWPVVARINTELADESNERLRKKEEQMKQAEWNLDPSAALSALANTNTGNYLTSGSAIDSSLGPALMTGALGTLLGGGHGAVTGGGTISGALRGGLMGLGAGAGMPLGANLAATLGADTGLLGNDQNMNYSAAGAGGVGGALGGAALGNKLYELLAGAYKSHLDREYEQRRKAEMTGQKMAATKTVGMDGGTVTVPKNQIPAGTKFPKSYKPKQFTPALGGSAPSWAGKPRLKSIDGESVGPNDSRYSTPPRTQPNRLPSDGGEIRKEKSGAFEFGAKLAAVTTCAAPKHNDQSGVDVNPVAAGTPAAKEKLTKKMLPLKAQDVVGKKANSLVNFVERKPKHEHTVPNGGNLSPRAAGDDHEDVREETEAHEFGRRMADQYR